MTPTQLQGESTKAFNAFKVYCEVDGHPSQVCKRLSCSRQNISKWIAKWHWRARLTSLRQREAERRIKAEQRATDAVAVITESEKASVWRAAFILAASFIRRANEISNVQPVAASTLARTAFNIIESVHGGVARGFQVNTAVINQAQREYPTLAFDDAGHEVDVANLAIKSYKEALAILDRGEPLPCDDWNPDSIHATPTFTETGENKDGAADGSSGFNKPRSR